jgi:hypothetical protein
MKIVLYFYQINPINSIGDNRRGHKEFPSIEDGP